MVTGFLRKAIPHSKCTVRSQGGVPVTVADKVQLLAVDLTSPQIQELMKLVNTRMAAESVLKECSLGKRRPRCEDEDYEDGPGRGVRKVRLVIGVEGVEGQRE